MITAELQQQINSSWNAWKQRRHLIEPKRIRKKNLCPKCGKKGFLVKMDYLGNRHVQMKVTRYEITKFKCPRCGHVEEPWMRIEGKGTRGTDMYKLYGGR